MFKVVKKAAVSFALKSFAGRLSVITALHESRKMPDAEYEYQKGLVMKEYYQYLYSIPSDLWPEGADDFG